MASSVDATGMPTLRGKTDSIQVWTQETICDLARGRFVTIRDAASGAVAVPAWLDAVGTYDDSASWSTDVRATHPDDRARTVRAWFQAIERPGEAIVTEYRTRKDDGVHQQRTTMVNLIAMTLGGVLIVTEDLDVTAADDDWRAGPDPTGSPTWAVGYLDEFGTMLHFEGALAELYGRSVDEVLGHATLDFVDQDHQDAVIGGWLEVVDDPRGRCTRRYPIVQPDRTRTWVESTFINRLADPRITAIMVVTHDITAQLADEAALEFQGRLLEAVGDAVIATDDRSRITFWNRAAEELFGYPHADALGAALDLIMPAEIGASMFGSVPPAGSQQVETVATRQDGGHIHIAVTMSPTFDADHHVVGSTVVARDISARVAAAADADRQRRRAAAAERVAQRETVERAAADQANRAKTEFLSRMSHELRTPLNAIIGFGQVLELSSTLSPSDEEDVGYILVAGRHLLDLINEVLDLARIETNQLGLALEPVALAEVIDAAVALLGPTAAAHSVTVTTTLDANPHTSILADRQRLLQVILNLLSNAIKYNRIDGTVEISVDARPPDRLRVSVRDTGPGLSVQDRDRLYTPFDRLGAERLGVDGTGVGLALSKGLVEQMGGRLDVTSYPPDGATFWFELPTADPRQPLAPARPGPPTDPGTGALTVLYIEDNQPNIKVVEAMLATRSAPITFLSALDGRRGLELARRHLPDLILLDIHLPEMDGAEVLAAIRADPELSHIIVTIVSADATDRQIDRMYGLGADHYLTKPIAMTDLLDIVDHTSISPHRPEPGRS